jgi:hypothetical protein
MKVVRAAILIWALSMSSNALHARGPLQVSTDNPRYFTDDSGEAIYLTGAHTWANLVDISPEDPPQPCDFAGYLAWLETYGHNFIRMWTWELTAWSTEATGDKRLLNVSPLPWPRVGPGSAIDGKPRFDLESPMGLENLLAGSHPAFHGPIRWSGLGKEL